MHIQQNTGIPTVNGLSGNFPKHDWPTTEPPAMTPLAGLASPTLESITDCAIKTIP